MSLNSISEGELRFAVLTVSDTRTAADDKGGKRVVYWLEQNHYKCMATAIVKDDAIQIRKQVEEWANSAEIDVIITTGGTGIAKRDVTLEALTPIFSKVISGFGEIFRFLSFTDDIGTRAMASRAEAGVVENTIVFAIPGSVGAINLAMERLIIPEAGHLAFELRK